MLTDRDLITLKREYGEVSLMGIVKTATEYLRAMLGPVGLEYRGRPIELDLTRWGSRRGDGTYVVCLGGLWYLLETGYLVEAHIPLVVQFLDVLRYPMLASKQVQYLLGIDTRPFLDRVSESDTKHDTCDPGSVLVFLDWLVSEYNKSHTHAMDYLEDVWKITIAE